MATSAIQFGDSERVPRMLGDLIDEVFDDPGKRDSFTQKMNERDLSLDDFDAALSLLADSGPLGSAFGRGGRFITDAVASLRSLGPGEQDLLRQRYLSKLHDFRESQTGVVRWGVLLVEYCGVGPSDSQRFKVFLQSGGSKEFIFVDIGKDRYEGLREQVLRSLPGLPVQSVPTELRGLVKSHVIQLEPTFGTFHSGETINWD
jgi:hypothetical protein